MLYCKSNYPLSHDTKHIHTLTNSYSIKVVMAVLCCENDCISIGKTLGVHRAVLCMLMQAVKTDLGMGGGPGAITLPQSPDKTVCPRADEALLQAFPYY